MLFAVDTRDILQRCLRNFLIAFLIENINTVAVRRLYWIYCDATMSAIYGIHFIRYGQ